MTKELVRFYLDNEPWLFDSEAQVFTHERDSARRLTEEDVRTQGLHVASLMVVLVKGSAWYYDERLQELRRVAEPTVVLTFEQFNLLSEPEQALSIPKGASFKLAMRKEAAHRERRQRMRDADCGMGV